MSRFALMSICIAAASAAHAAGAAPWEFKREDGSCAIHHEVEGADGSIARATVSWRDEEGGGGAIATIHRSLPRGTRVTSRFAGSGDERQHGPMRQMYMIGIEGFAKARAHLLAGRALELVVESRGQRAQLYATGVVGVKQAIAALDRCIEDAKRAAQPQAARWTATTSGTMGAQACSLSVSGMIGIEGVAGTFSAIRPNGVRFDASSSPSYFANGGALRIDLPGAKGSWMLDTEQYDAATDSRSATLLSQLASGASPKMAFIPRGRQAVPVSMPLENWKPAAAMFDACRAAASGGMPQKIVSYTELRHAVEETPEGCLLTGTYQLLGNGIWLVLTTEGGKPALKVTHRTLGNGYKLQSMDLRRFGGRRNVTAPDTTLPIDAATFAEVRRGLVGSGVEFGIEMPQSKTYAAPFGGELGRIEAAMFEACVKAKQAQ
jgi:hypothetical protein